MYHFVGIIGIILFCCVDTDPSTFPDVVALDGLPPQDPKVLGPAHHEPRELAAQHLLHLVSLLCDISRFLRL